MTVTDSRPPEIGRARLRKEDARLTTGRGRFTDNISLPGTLYLGLVRSPVAHARIASIDVSAARDAPGVVRVFTGADLADEQGSLPNAWPVTPDQLAPPHPAVAVDTVAFAGEIVAVVVARSRAQARDAQELVDVDYEELPLVLDLEEAATDSTLVHPDLGTNVSATWVFDSAEAGTGGEVEAALAESDVVVERTIRQQRLIPAFMEPRSVLVDPSGEQITMWSATQVPHIAKLMLALTLGIPESKLRVIAPDVGGGFGGKLAVTPEEVITILAARRTGKPCKYTETRSESLMGAHHGRDHVQHLRIGAKADGTVTGLDVRIVADMGAYLGLITSGIPILGAFMYNGIYKFSAYRFECRNVFTNRVWTDAYRGAGRPEATFAIERMMDELATELDMDPIALREKNWIAHEEFPFDTVASLTYDTGDYEAATAKALELFDYDELRAEQARRRKSGDPIQLGIGVSTFTEMCGLAPSRVLGALNYAAGGWEYAQVRVLATGNVEVVTGTSPHGQGHVTSWSQLVADRLGVPFENVEVLHGDTQIAQKGLDTYGSRSLSVGGMAVLAAADKVIEKARIVAAHMLEAAATDVEFTDGRFSVRGTDQGVSFADVAFATFSAHDLPDGFEPSLDADATFDPENFSFPHGTHLAAMEVDTETGRASVRAYVCVDDVGTVVNPMLVEGQVHGGLAQGISQALYEEAVYDEFGTLVTGSFTDYLVPSAPDLPEFVTDRTTTPATSNELGVKGVGEAGTIASTPAIVNGILDAIRHLGVTDLTMPCTPARVWHALEAARSTGTAPSATEAGA
ncbi:molybdopterin-dependent oxidoreductase [Pseudactinotalea sp. HY160]|uniref:xanthine dehydrogenase family protein molybdopterin-binding subunit n=1 Tax=Pseudactinotalea sp. HY160 TaxID=2654490 RepID=UPI00128CB325|nr:xanthine dehydrogenase family protein molybdopterin-binding subunit [Pseudactinotalea sp. HY160]MPV49642.1 molybdopterin-dependent oxidoreductase [Pseudactinotalea sp. HY160]